MCVFTQLKVCVCVCVRIHVQKCTHTCVIPLSGIVFHKIDIIYFDY